MEYPVHYFGGSGPILNFAVANGFPPETYVPMLRRLLPHYRVMSLLPRALWTGEEPPQTEIRDWRQTLTQDLITGMLLNDIQDVIAVGHSFGGIASLLAVLEDPRRFRALILLDPTILSPELLKLLEAARADDNPETPLASRAIKRRCRFENVDDAYHYFKNKSLFAAWHDEALRLYAEQGTRPCGNGVCLRWSPQWEAYYFNTIYTKIWGDLPLLDDLSTPVLIVRGTESDTFLPETAEKVCRLVPDATYIEIEGHGHLFPQTAPEKTTDIILHWLDERGIVRR